MDRVLNAPGRPQLPVMYNIDIPFTVKKMPARTIIGISRRTSNADGRSVQDIPNAWATFLQQNANARIRNRSMPPTMYAVYSDYAGDWKGEYSYLIGCGVTRAGSIPDGMEVRKIPAQTCAVFTAAGKMPDQVTATWAEIWLSDLPRKYTYDFEVYDQRFVHPTRKVVEICVAVDPKKMERTQKSAQ